MTSQTSTNHAKMIKIMCDNIGAEQNILCPFMDEENSVQMLEMVDSPETIHDSDSESENSVQEKDEELLQILWKKTRNINFLYLPTTKVTFSYNDLESLYAMLKESFQRKNAKRSGDFIWANIIRWLLAMKRTFEELIDHDRKFYLILTDFMAAFIHYKCIKFSQIKNKSDANKIANEIPVVLGVFFEGKITYKLITLLKTTASCEEILCPIFEKYLSNKSLYSNIDFVLYVMLILCYKKWKTFVYTREEREKINEIAMGKHFSDENPVGVLPKKIPAINNSNAEFASVLPYFKLAKHNEVERGKNAGSRILLRDNLSNLGEMIKKFICIYKNYVNICTVSNIEALGSLPSLENDQWYLTHQNETSSTKIGKLPQENCSRPTSEKSSHLLISSNRRSSNLRVPQNCDKNRNKSKNCVRQNSRKRKLLGENFRLIESITLLSSDEDENNTNSRYDCNKRRSVSNIDKTISSNTGSEMSNTTQNCERERLNLISSNNSSPIINSSGYNENENGRNYGNDALNMIIPDSSNMDSIYSDISSPDEDEVSGIENGISSSGIHEDSISNNHQSSVDVHGQLNDVSEQGTLLTPQYIQPNPNMCYVPPLVYKQHPALFYSETSPINSTNLPGQFPIAHSSIHMITNNGNIDSNFPLNYHSRYEYEYNAIQYFNLRFGSYSNNRPDTESVVNRNNSLFQMCLEKIQENFVNQQQPLGFREGAVDNIMRTSNVVNSVDSSVRNEEKTLLSTLNTNLQNTNLQNTNKNLEEYTVSTTNELRTNSMETTTTIIEPEQQHMLCEKTSLDCEKHCRPISELSNVHILKETASTKPDEMILNVENNNYTEKTMDGVDFLNSRETIINSEAYTTKEIESHNLEIAANTELLEKTVKKSLVTQEDPICSSSMQISTTEKPSVLKDVLEIENQCIPVTTEITKDSKNLHETSHKITELIKKNIFVDKKSRKKRGLIEHYKQPLIIEKNIFKEMRSPTGFSKNDQEMPLKKRRLSQCTKSDTKTIQLTNEDFVTASLVKRINESIECSLEDPSGNRKVDRDLNQKDPSNESKNMELNSIALDKNCENSNSNIIAADNGEEKIMPILSQPVEEMVCQNIDTKGNELISCTMDNIKRSNDEPTEENCSNMDNKLKENEEFKNNKSVISIGENPMKGIQYRKLIEAIKEDEDHHHQQQQQQHQQESEKGSSNEEEQKEQNRISNCEFNHKKALKEVHEKTRGSTAKNDKLFEINPTEQKEASDNIEQVNEKVSEKLQDGSENLKSTFEEEQLPVVETLNETDESHINFEKIIEPSSKAGPCHSDILYDSTTLYSVTILNESDKDEAFLKDSKIVGNSLSKKSDKQAKHRKISKSQKDQAQLKQQIEMNITDILVPSGQEHLKTISTETRIEQNLNRNSDTLKINDITLQPKQIETKETNKFLNSKIKEDEKPVKSSIHKLENQKSIKLKIKVVHTTDQKKSKKKTGQKLSKRNKHEEKVQDNCEEPLSDISISIQKDSSEPALMLLTSTAEFAQNLNDSNTNSPLLKHNKSVNDKKISDPDFPNTELSILPTLSSPLLLKQKKGKERKEAKRKGKTPEIEVKKTRRKDRASDGANQKSEQAAKPPLRHTRHSCNTSQRQEVEILHRLALSDCFYKNSATKYHEKPNHEVIVGASNNFKNMNFKSEDVTNNALCSIADVRGDDQMETKSNKSTSKKKHSKRHKKRSEKNIRNEKVQEKEINQTNQTKKAESLSVKDTKYIITNATIENENNSLKAEEKTSEILANVEKNHDAIEETNLTDSSNTKHTGSKSVEGKNLEILTSVEKSPDAIDEVKLADLSNTKHTGSKGVERKKLEKLSPMEKSPDAIEEVKFADSSNTKHTGTKGVEGKNLVILTPVEKSPDTIEEVKLADSSNTKHTGSKGVEGKNLEIFSSVEKSPDAIEEVKLADSSNTEHTGSKGSEEKNSEILTSEVKLGDSSNTKHTGSKGVEGKNLEILTSLRKNQSEKYVKSNTLDNSVIDALKGPKEPIKCVKSEPIILTSLVDIGILTNETFKVQRKEKQIKSNLEDKEIEIKTFNNARNNEETQRDESTMCDESIRNNEAITEASVDTFLGIEKMGITENIKNVLSTDIDISSLPLKTKNIPGSSSFQINDGNISSLPDDIFAVEDDKASINIEENESLKKFLEDKRTEELVTQTLENAGTEEQRSEHKNEESNKDKPESNTDNSFLPMVEENLSTAEKEITPSASINPFESTEQFNPLLYEYDGHSDILSMKNVHDYTKQLVAPNAEFPNFEDGDGLLISTNNSSKMSPNSVSKKNLSPGSKEGNVTIDTNNSAYDASELFFMAGQEYVPFELTEMLELGFNFINDPTEDKQVNQTPNSIIDENERNSIPLISEDFVQEIPEEEDNFLPSTPNTTCTEEIGPLLNKLNIENSIVATPNPECSDSDAEERCKSSVISSKDLEDASTSKVHSFPKLRDFPKTDGKHQMTSKNIENLKTIAPLESDKTSKQVTEVKQKNTERTSEGEEMSDLLKISPHTSSLPANMDNTKESRCSIQLKNDKTVNTTTVTENQIENALNLSIKADETVIVTQSSTGVISNQNKIAKIP